MSAAGSRSGARALRRLRRAAVALAAALVLPACAAQQGGWPLLGEEEPPARPWVGFENEGPLPVEGADEDAPGPAIYRHVARQPALRGFLREQGRPAALEVARREGGALRVVLRYPERGGCRIRLERAPDADARWSASLPDCPQARRSQPPPEPEPPEPEGAAPEPAEGEPARGPDPPAGACRPPTALQRLECPIDPDRRDCAALCRCDAGLEWCE